VKLFYAPGACSLASHVALEEAGARYEAVRFDLKAGDQTDPDYLKINPKGRVPTLVTDGGPLTENPAILTYVAQTYPEAKLAPTNPYDLAIMQSFNMFLSSSVHAAFTHAFRPGRFADGDVAAAAMKAKVVPTLKDYFGMIENGMLKGPWVMGEQFTVADIYLFVFAGWLARLDPNFIDTFPRLKDHWTRVKARPAVQKTLSDEA
jgi:glutathione S-transferase